MVIDFTISNFRSIKAPLTLSFEANNDTHLEDYFIVKKGKYRLLKMVSLLGANASGKSNILRAFMMFPSFILSPCEDKSSKIGFKSFALDPDMDKVDSTLIINFICKEQKYYYEVHFNNEYVSYELLKSDPFDDNLSTRKVFERQTDPTSMVSSVKLGGKYKSFSTRFKDLKVNLLHNRTVFGAFYKSNIDIPWMKDITDWVKNYWLPMVKTTNQHLDEYTSECISNGSLKKEDVVSFLSKADFGISDLSINEKVVQIPKEVVDIILGNNEAPEDLKRQVREDPTARDIFVRMSHKGKSGIVPFEFKEESRGTQRYYELSSVLLQICKDPHFVAIDELESRMHPDLYEHFLVTYLKNAKDSQLVFTTHMREFLMNREIYRDDSVWFTEKNIHGATELFSLIDFGSEILRKDSSRYNAYRAGRIGAVPNLGDTKL